MTMQIALSQAGPDFADRVERHRQARIAHQATIDVPAPVDDPLVEACIRRVRKDDGPDEFVADYQIVDDTPSLAERKVKLMGVVSEMEGVAAAAVAPFGKRRLFALRSQEIAHREMERTNAASLKRAAIAAKPELSARPPICNSSRRPTTCPLSSLLAAQTTMPPSS